MKTIKHLLVPCAAIMLSMSACAAHNSKSTTTSYHKATTSKVVKSKIAHKATVVRKKVNINTADINTLRTVKGIGPKRANAIINYRNKYGKFKSIYELKKLKGHDYSFSKKFIRSIKRYITL